MSGASRTEIFAVNIEKIFKVITDYESYPKFVDSVKAVKIVEESKTKKLVEFDVEMMKSVNYRLTIKEAKGTGISWELDSGDLFKKNTGGWKLKKIDDKTTEVTYEIDVEFKGLVPKMVITKLVETTLPSMMKSYEARAKKIK